MSQFPATMHHFWATWYVVPGIIVFIVSVICFLLFAGMTLSTDTDESESHTFGLLALASAASALLSFVWPVLLLTGIVYVFVRLTRNLK